VRGYVEGPSGEGAREDLSLPAHRICHPPSYEVPSGHVFEEDPELFGGIGGLPSCDGQFLRVLHPREELAVALLFSAHLPMVATEIAPSFGTDVSQKQRCSYRESESTVEDTWRRSVRHPDSYVSPELGTTEYP